MLGALRVMGAGKENEDRRTGHKVIWLGGDKLV